MTAEGDLVRASAEQNPDLLWALRGGGGNFGVVTSFEFQLHPVAPIVYGGMVAWPFEAARDVLKFYGRDLPRLRRTISRSTPASSTRPTAIMSSR